MKKIYLALMCMASLSLMTACGDKKSDKGDAKEDKTETTANNDENNSDENDIDDEELEPQPTSDDSEIWGDPYEAEFQDLVALYASGDFKPAINVIFEDTLSEDTEDAGELPTKWDIKEGSAEIGLTRGHRFIKLLGGTTVLCPKVGTNDFLPSKYTLEFEFMFGKDVWYHVNFFNTEEENLGNFNMWLCTADWNFAKTDSEDWIYGDKQELDKLVNRDGWNHFAASYDNGNMKIFINGKRIANLPNIKQAAYFYITGDGADGESHYIRSIRICK